MLKSGMIIGDRYEIIEHIGAGGMSDVYKARCHKLKRFVAIKVLKQEFSENKGFVSKFRVEAQSAAGLSHPNIVNVYDVGEENGLHYIVMELVEGITLKQYIEKKARLSTKEAISIAIQVSMGIEAAHYNHIIHRDIKPQNIIISREGKVKVTDFGIARAVTSNTITSNVMGSVHYTSPEQARGGYSDEKSDIYSLGITMYEMLTGRVPFNGETTVAIAIKHIQDEMPSPRVLIPEIPVSIEQIIFKCTQKSPDRRYAKMSDLIEDLKYSLMYPNEDFVKKSDGILEGETKMIDDRDLHTIKRGTRRTSNPVPPPVRKSKRYEEDYEEEDEEEYYEEEEEDEEDEEEMNPKMEKIVTVLGIIAAVIIACIALYLIGRTVGLFKATPGKTESGNQIEENLEDEEEENKDEMITVPNLVGLTVSEAKEKLKELGLGYTQSGTAESDVVKKGCVSEQDIEAGEEVKKNTTVKVVISTGIATSKLPNVVGTEEAAAKKKLEELGVTVSSTYEWSSTVAEGAVISTKPEAGSEVAKGDTISMVVSRGTEIVEVTMPDVRGLSEQTARQNLTALGLTVGVVSPAYSDTVEAGNVISQSYTPGISLEQGRMIDLVVSAGKDPATIEYRGTVRIEKPVEFESSGTVKLVLTQIVNGSEVSTTVFEGNLTESSFPYTKQMTGANGVASGIVTVYVNGVLASGTYNVNFTAVS